MGHGLRCPLSVYVLPEGVRYLVIEVAGRNGGSMLCSELGAAAVHVVMDEDNQTVFIDNVAYRSIDEASGPQSSTD
jgi:hypothetical protein